MASSSTAKRPVTMSDRCCSVCKYGRSNVIIYPCQHVAHSRCIFPWPIVVCPICQSDVRSVSCLPVESFSFLGESCELSNTSKVFGTDRNSRWSAEETKYVALLVKAFESGKLPVQEGCQLMSFLHELLQRPIAKLQSKIPVSVPPYASDSSVSGCESVIQYLQLQVSISAAENALLSSVAGSSDIEVGYTIIIPNCGSETAVVCDTGIVYIVSPYAVRMDEALHSVQWRIAAQLISTD
jgi:hypothetical protein